MANRYDLVKYFPVTYVSGSTFNLSFKTRYEKVNNVRKIVSSNTLEISYHTNMTAYLADPSTATLFHSETFGVGSAWATKQYSNALPLNAAVIEFKIDGTVTVVQENDPATGTITATGQLIFDDFIVTINKPLVQIGPSGMLIYSSPDQFIRLTNDGLEMKGGSVTVDTLRVNELEIYGNAVIFGDLEASALSPYNSTPFPISEDNTG